LELVLGSYVKACGKESVKEILAERDVSFRVLLLLIMCFCLFIDYG